MIQFILLFFVFVWHTELLLHYLLDIRTWSVMWVVYLPLVPSIFLNIFKQCSNLSSYMYVSMFLPGWNSTSCPCSLPPPLLGLQLCPFPSTLFSLLSTLSVSLSSVTGKLSYDRQVNNRWLYRKISVVSLVNGKNPIYTLFVLIFITVLSQSLQFSPRVALWC